MRTGGVRGDEEKRSRGGTQVTYLINKCGGHFNLPPTICTCVVVVFSLIGLMLKIFLAKILATINLGALIWLESKKCRPPHKVLVKILAKNLANVLACPSFGKANFSTKPIRLFVQNNETMSKHFM